MIKPVGAYSVSYKADNHSVDKTGHYTDPMMNWPLRGAAFTNEVGEALRPLIGNYANLTWVPALMYIGADVYDKYKNDQTEYSPDSRRALKQAVFQGLASVALPVVAVKIGQNIFSQFGKFGKDKISLNAKEHISRAAERFIENGKMRAFEGNDEECVKEFLAQVIDSADYHSKKDSLNNSVRIFKHDKKEHFGEYAEKTIRDLIQLRKDLINPTEEIKSGGWYSKYILGLKNGQTESVAIKSVLTKYQKGKMLKGNFVKTIGGFTALGLSIKPIDHFVENVLIGRYVGPQIDKIKTK